MSLFCTAETGRIWIKGSIQSTERRQKRGTLGQEERTGDDEDDFRAVTSLQRHHQMEQQRKARKGGLPGSLRPRQKVKFLSKREAKKLGWGEKRWWQVLKGGKSFLPFPFPPLAATFNALERESGLKCPREIGEKSTSGTGETHKNFKSYQTKSGWVKRLRGFFCIEDSNIKLGGMVVPLAVWVANKTSYIWNLNLFRKTDPKYTLQDSMCLLLESPP